MERLPSDITSDILSRLPAELVLECKLVFRNWRDLVRHPSFSKLHLNHLNCSSDSGELGFLAFTDPEYRCDKRSYYYFEYDESKTPPIESITRFNFTLPLEHARFAGSCHGLICLAEGSATCIFNPITKELVMLPQIVFNENGPWCCIQARSFSYVSSTNEYKVLGTIKTDAECIRVYIYTLGSGNGWRYIGDSNCLPDLSRQCFSANGTLYWMNIRLEMVGTFDLAEEKLGEHLSPPPLPQDIGWWRHRIGVLDGVLFFAVRQLEQHDIWLLKNKNDDKKEGEEHHSLGWIKLSRVADCNLVAFTKSDGILTYKDGHLNIHDTRTSTSKSLVKFRLMLSKVSPHKNTFVSLKELGEEKTETMEAGEFEETDEDVDPEYIYL